MTTTADYLTPILRRIINNHPEARQRDFARACGRHESWVSQLKAGKAHLYAFELDIFCDHYGTNEPLDAVADRLNLELQERRRLSATPGSYERHSAFAAAKGVETFVFHQDAKADGVITDDEADLLETKHQIAIDAHRIAKSRVPRVHTRKAVR